MKSSNFVDQLLNVHGNSDRFSYAAFAHACAALAICSAAFSLA